MKETLISLADERYAFDDYEEIICSPPLKLYLYYHQSWLVMMMMIVVITIINKTIRDYELWLYLRTIKRNISVAIQSRAYTLHKAHNWEMRKAQYVTTSIHIQSNALLGLFSFHFFFTKKETKWEHEWKRTRRNRISLIKHFCRSCLPHFILIVVSSYVEQLRWYWWITLCLMIVCMRIYAQYVHG